MTILIDSLERILDAIEKHEDEGYKFFPSNSPFYEEEIDFLTSGLQMFDVEVNEILSDIPFYLPQELLELYAWANGTHKWACYSFIGDEVFLSLKEASKTYHRKYKDAEREAREKGLNSSESWWKEHWFPIFLRDDQDYFILGSSKQVDASPIFLFDYRDGANAYDELGREIGPKLMFTSLTSMALTIAECLETGAYYPFEFQDRETTRAFFKVNSEEVEAIRLKYNHNANELYSKLFPEEKLHSPGYYDLLLS